MAKKKAQPQSFWHTPAGYLLPAGVLLTVSYILGSLAIDSGSIAQWIGTIVALVWGIMRLVQGIKQLIVTKKPHVKKR